MRNNKYQQKYNTPYQLKLPLEIEKIIESSDPVYTFSEVMNQIDLKRYLVIKENKTGRKRFDSEILLEVILFAFMEHGMEKYMKLTMFKKETDDKTYRDNPYRAVNFPINENGNPVCPNEKEMHYLYSQPVKKNKYGRTEEVCGCEDCNGCPHRKNCCNGEGNRTIH